MANEAFKAWYVQGLQAVKTAADQGKAASAELTGSTLTLTRLRPRRTRSGS